MLQEMSLGGRTGKKKMLWITGEDRELEHEALRGQKSVK